MLRFFITASLLILGTSLSEGQQASEDFPHRVASEHLPNVVRVHPQILSGGLPASNEAFRELHSRGIKTIISVDGMTPDVETARKYGLRYVHLPHGYDGIPAERVQELAKAVRELPAPIYIHCHHGQHRSAAAASVACVASGLIPSSQSLNVLELAGTSPHYRGLYESVRQVQPFEATQLRELKVEFKEKVEIPPMAQAMVDIERTHHHLQLIAASDWQSPPAHPDLDPAHEALLLKEHFAELLRTDSVQEQPEEFRMLLEESARASQALEHALRQQIDTASDSNLSDSKSLESIHRLSDNIATRCTACHQQFRDLPREVD